MGQDTQDRKYFGMWNGEGIHECIGCPQFNRHPLERNTLAATSRPDAGDPGFPTRSAYHGLSAARGTAQVGGCAAYYWLHGRCAGANVCRSIHISVRGDAVATGSAQLLRLAFFAQCRRRAKDHEGGRESFGRSDTEFVGIVRVIGAAFARQFHSKLFYAPG